MSQLKYVAVIVLVAAAVSSQVSFAQEVYQAEGSSRSDAIVQATNASLLISTCSVFDLKPSVDYATFCQTLNDVANQALQPNALEVRSVYRRSHLGSYKATVVAKFPRGEALDLATLLAAAGESDWRLNEAQLDVRLGWSREMFGGQFANRQPEQLTAEEWSRIVDRV